jgi:hypothetical protein
MVERLLINKPTIEKLNLNQSVGYDADTEYALQEMADIPHTMDFKGLRENLALNQQEQDMYDMIQGAEQALKMGVNSVYVTDMVKNYIPQNTTDISLEYEAASVATDKALADNELTYVNNMSEDEDVIQNVEDFAVNLQFSEIIDDINKSAQEEGALKTIGSYVWHGLTSDISLINDIRSKVTAVDWGDATTYDAMNKKFIEHYNNTKENLGMEGLSSFLKTLKDQIKSIESPAGRLQMKQIMTEGDTFGDFANGLPIIGALTPAAAVGKMSGNMKAAREAIKFSDDVMETVPSGIKKVTRKDNLINYANDVEVHNSLEASKVDELTMNYIKNHKKDTGNVLSDVDKEILHKSVSNNSKAKRLDIVDVSDISVKEEGGIKLTTLMGNGLDGQSAMTKKGVDNLAKELGITDYKAVKKDGSGYYLQTEVDSSSLDLSTSDFGSMGFGRFFFGSSNMPAWFHEELIANYRRATRMEKNLFDEYGKHLRKLSGRDKDAFVELYLEGQRANNNRGVWFNVDKLVKEGKISQKTADAYTAFRKVSDMDYIISNTQIRNKLLKHGYISDDSGDIVKVIKKGVTSMPNYSHMKIQYGDKILTARTHSAEQLNKLLQNGDVLVEIAPISIKTSNLKYTHKIINPSKLKKTLDFNILPYRAGGRRRYAYGTNFLKIGVTEEYGGELVNAYSKVLGAVDDFNEAKKIRDELNKALNLMQTLKNTDDAVRVNSEIVNNPFKYLKIYNTEDLKAATEGLSLDQTVQILKEGESMVYNNGRRTLYEDPLDYDMAFAELSKVRGTYDSKRGNILDNLIGKEARLVNPFDIFDQTVRRASFNKYLGQLYDQMGQIFKNKYIDLIDTRVVSNPRTLSGEELLRNGKLKNLLEVPAEQRQALREAINIQNIYKRLTNTPTDVDKYVKRMMNNLAGVFTKLGVKDPKTLEFIASKDPFSYGRAMLFQTTLGLMNLKQLWAQSLGAVTMFPAHPITYTRAILATPFVLTGYALRNSPVFKNLAKGLSTLTGISPKDFDNLLKYFDEMGTTMGTYRMPMSERVATWNSIEKLGAVMRSPVELGTNIANAVNDVAAYLSSPVKNFKKIAARADDWSMNQTRATQSVFQAGQYLPTKTIAQFTAWPYRVMEAMTLNKRLTTQEKIAIFLGQVAMWGATGTLFNKEHASKINRELYPHLQDIPEWLRDTFLEGAVTSFFREEGINVDEGIEGGGILSGAWKIADAILSEDISKIDFELPGSFKAISRLTSTAKAMLELAYGVTADDNFDALKYAYNVSTDKNMASSFRNGARAFLGWYYHKNFNTAGKLVSDSVTKEQSIGMLFGASLNDAAVSAELYNIYSDSERIIKELYEDGLQGIVKEMSMDLSSSPENRRDLSIRFSHTLKALRTAIKDEYGISGVRILNKMLRKDLSQLSVNDNNKRYGRQNGEIAVQYLSELYNFNRSE